MEACGICLQEIKATDLWVLKGNGVIGNDFGGYDSGKYHVQCYKDKRKKGWIIVGIFLSIIFIIFIVIFIVIFK